MSGLIRRGSFRLWFEFWTRMSRQLRDRSLNIHGGLLTPYPGQPYLRSLQVQGWLFVGATQSLDLTVGLGGRTVAASTVTIEPDQVRHKVPFAFSIEPRQLDGLGSTLLTIHVRTPTGRTSLVAFTPVRRVKRVPKGLARSEYAQVWDGVSSTWKEARVSVAGYSDQAEWERSGQSTADFVTRCLDLQPSDRVLEIGCGTGRIGRCLAPRCKEWVGSDVSANMLSYAKRDLSHLPNVSLIRLNGYDLDNIESESFDAVYCSAVFMHLDEWDRYRYVTEAKRVLRPGGRAFFDNYNLLGDAGWRFFEDTCALDLAVRPPNVSRSSTPQELVEYFRRAGFTEVRADEGDLFVTVLGSRPA